MEASEVHTCLALARLYWTIERYEESRKWYDRLSTYSTSRAVPDLAWEHNVLGARLALREGRPSAAQIHIACARESPNAGLDLPRLVWRACEIELRLEMRDCPCTETELEDLVWLHKRARGLGCHDEVMLAIFLSLRFYGRESEAMELVRAYLHHHRRDGFQIDSRLVNLCCAETPSVPGARTHTVHQSTESA